MRWSVHPARTVATPLGNKRLLRRFRAPASSLGFAFIFASATIGCGDGDVQGTPIDVVAEARSSTSIAVSWVPQLQDAAHLVRIFRAAGAIDEGALFAEAGGTSTVAVDLMPNTTYFFSVQSIHPVLGDSAPSDLVSATTPFGPLDAPAGLRAVETNADSVVLQWENDDDSAERFSIEQRQPPGQFQEVRSVNASVLTATVSGLSFLTDYQFRVRSIRGDDVSAFTSAITVTTPAPAGVAITSLFPTSGPATGGFPIAIEGWGFTRGPPQVLFGSNPATDVIVINDTHLSCRAPTGAAGPVVVRVVGPADSVMDAEFTYVGSETQSLTIEPQGSPSVSFDNTIGVTTVAASFVVRDEDGLPIRADALTTRSFVDGEELGVSNRFNEGLLDERSEALAQNVYLFLTLDASFSLIAQFDPEQFTPMLTESTRLINKGLAIWGEGPDDPNDPIPNDKFGQFFWEVAWFRELIEIPTSSTITPDRIATIAPPTEGNETKMRAAVSYHVEASAERFGAGIANGPLDRHIVVVFADGQDNLSWFDNPNVSLNATLTDGSPSRRFGWRAVGLTDLFEEIVEHPMYPDRFELYAIRLGNADDTPLAQLAQVGLGRFFGEETNVTSLFDRLAAEITDQVIRGATLAIEPGEYEFRIEVTRTETGDQAEYTFTFRVP